MLTRVSWSGVALGLALAANAAAQEQKELLARVRVFPEVSAGVTAIRARGTGAERRYYILAPFAGGTRLEYRIQVYDAGGQHVACVPACPGGAASSTSSTSSTSLTSSLFSGDDFDIDSAGRLYVAQRGANAILVFTPDGTPARTIPIAAPTSVAALGAGEIAVSSMKTPKLVTVFNTEGKIAREFGDPAETTARPELNRFLHIGRLATDPADHIYYSFSYLPEPTVRKYDRFGYAQVEVELATLEFQPAARAARREIARQTSGRGTPSMRAVITAVGVEAENEGLWVALGGVLLQFDREGVRRGTYRTFTADGTRVEASSILVEPERLLIASDTLGVFEFPRPDKPPAPR